MQDEDNEDVVWLMSSYRMEYTPDESTYEQYVYRALGGDARVVLSAEEYAEFGYPQKLCVRIALDEGWVL